MCKGLFMRVRIFQKSRAPLVHLAPGCQTPSLTHCYGQKLKKLNTEINCLHLYENAQRKMPESVSFILKIS